MLIKLSTFTAFAAVITLVAAGSAWAQEFKGDCKPFGEKAACETTGWCRWTDKKAITLPNGQQFQPKSFCAFKPGFKAGFKATAEAKQ